MLLSLAVTSLIVVYTSFSTSQGEDAQYNFKKLHAMSLQSIYIDISTYPKHCQFEWGNSFWNELNKRYPNLCLWIHRQCKIQIFEIKQQYSIFISLKKISLSAPCWKFISKINIHIHSRSVKDALNWEEGVLTMAGLEKPNAFSTEHFF